MLSIKPVPPKHRFELGTTSITLYMDPEEKTNYTVYINGNLTDVWGQKLGNQSVKFSSIIIDIYVFICLVGSLRRYQSLVNNMSSKAILDVNAVKKEGLLYTFQQKNFKYEKIYF